MDSPMPAELALATFTTQPPKPAKSETFAVHFNPESLKVSVSNTLRDEGEGGKKKQFVDKVEARLSMTLQYDTTTSGEDVRVHTVKLEQLMRPVGEGSKQVPPNVEFSWGAYGFKGMCESFEETLDFFSANGVPLRASVSLTLAGQDVAFDSAADGGVGVGASVDVGLSAGIDTPVFSASASLGVGGAAGLSAQLGDPRGARAIASANGASSLRFGGESGMAVSSGIDLRGEAAFSVGGGAGLSAGIGGGVGVGAGGGVGAGASFGAGAGAAAGGAFGGLRSGASASASFSASASAPIGGGVGASASFGVGGQGSGASADVGVDADLNSLIRFA